MGVVTLAHTLRTGLQAQQRARDGPHHRQADQEDDRAGGPGADQHALVAALQGDELLFAALAQQGALDIGDRAQGLARGLFLVPVRVEQQVVARHVHRAEQFAQVGGHSHFGLADAGLLLGVVAREHAQLLQRGGGLGGGLAGAVAELVAAAQALGGHAAFGACQMALDLVDLLQDFQCVDYPLAVFGDVIEPIVKEPAYREQREQCRQETQRELGGNGQLHGPSPSYLCDLTMIGRCAVLGARFAQGGCACVLRASHLGAA